MSTINNILVPINWSACSDDAFQVAASLARSHGAELLVLFVVPLPTVMYGPAPEDYLEHMYQDLCRIKSSDPSMCVRHQLVEGDPAREILRAAEDNKSDLIVMGTHGRTGLTRLLMGSVAEQVVRNASCPVMIVQARQPLAGNSPEAGRQTTFAK